MVGVGMGGKPVSLGSRGNFQPRQRGPGSRGGGETVPWHLGFRGLAEISAVCRDVLGSEGFSWKWCTRFGYVGLKETRLRFTTAWGATVTSEWGMYCYAGEDWTLGYKDWGRQHSQGYLHRWRAVGVIVVLEMRCIILIRLARLQWRISTVILWLETDKKKLNFWKDPGENRFWASWFILEETSMQRKHAKIGKWENNEKNDHWSRTV